MPVEPNKTAEDQVLAADTSAVLKALISRYKHIIQKQGIRNELYKWELVKQNMHKLDTSDPNFASNLISVLGNNLFYPMSIATAKEMAAKKPQEYRQCYVDLFSENQPLAQRIDTFRKAVDDIYRPFGNNKPSHHDERAISNMLTFHDPTRYTFYKDSYYKKYCKLINAIPEKVGSKYPHYLSLMHDLIDKYINRDAELIELVDSKLSDKSYKDPNHMILAQDILYQTLEYKPSDFVNGGGFPNTDASIEGEKMQVPLNTILYGPPGTGKTYNSINMAVQIVDPEFMNNISNMSSSRAAITNRYRELVEEGRIVFTTFHQSMSYEDFIEGIKPIMDNEKDCQIQYEIVSGIFKRICEHAAAEIDDCLSSMYTGQHGNDSEEEAVDIEESAENPSIGNETLSRDLVFDRAYDHLISEIEDSIHKGDTYCFTTKRGAKHCALSVLPNNSIEIERQNAPSMSSYIVDRDKLKTLYLHFRNIDNLSIKEHDDYLRNVLGIGASNGPTYIAILSTLDQVANNLFHKQAQNNGIDDSIVQTPHSNAGGNTSQPVSREDLFKDVYEVLLGEIKKSLTQSGKYSFETMEGAIHNAIELSYDDRIKIQRLDSKIPPYYVPIDILKLLFMKTRDINNLSVTKIGDLIKGMKGGSNNHPTYWAITKKLIELAKIVPQVTESSTISKENNVPRITPAVTGNLLLSDCVANNYVLIIDEINRGNVSQIFGELITLIEPDKRAGMPEALEVTLPYSKDKFSVPANLYIIGTMNTADRSVEALDTALRRRFCFREMAPEYDLLQGSDYAGISLKSLLEMINLRIEGLLDKDHAIGHSYFLKVSKKECTLKSVFFNEIIPLLQEYFYGNFGRIELVLGSGFVKSTPVDLSVFALPSSDNDDFNDHMRYTLVRSMNDDDFLDALHTLMN